MIRIKYLNILLFSFLQTGFLKAQYNFIDAFPNIPDFTFPVGLQNSGDCTNRIFIVEKEGIIKVFKNNPDVSQVKTFLDITDRVFINDIEMGLLGPHISSGLFQQWIFLRELYRWKSAKNCSFQVSGFCY